MARHRTTGNAKVHKVSVSNKQRIDTQFGRWSPTVSTQGRKKVKIGGKNFLFSQLVALAFLPRAKPGQNIVHHMYGMHNDAPESLKRMTSKQHAKHHSTDANRSSNKQNVGRSVRGTPRGENNWTEYESMNDAERQTGVSARIVSKECYDRTTIHSYTHEFEFVLQPDLNINGVTEVWRSVPGLSGSCRVSNMQRFENSNGHRYSPCPGTAEGPYARVFNDGSNFTFHRLIALAFGDQLRTRRRRGQTIVHHRDGNPMNNLPSNLQWTTPKEHLKEHAEEHITGHATRVLKLSKPIEGRVKVNAGEPENAWVRYSSSAAAARDLGLDCGCVAQAVRQSQRSVKTYQFRASPGADQRDKDGEIWVDLQWQPDVGQLVCEKPKISPSGNARRTGGAAFTYVPPGYGDDDEDLEDDEEIDDDEWHRSTFLDNEDVEEIDDDEWHHTDLDRW